MRAGKLRHAAAVQTGTVVTDPMGGREEENFATFARWPVSVLPKPFVNSESQAALLYLLDGRHRPDILARFRAGETIRILVDGMTLKVMELEVIEQRGRKLRAHCGLAVKTV